MAHAFARALAPSCTAREAKRDRSLPRLLGQRCLPSICNEGMNVQRHAAGNEDERLSAFGCGHVFHTHCVVQMAEAMYGPCGCMEGASCPLCRCPISAAESALLAPFSRAKDDDFNPAFDDFNPAFRQALAEGELSFSFG